MAGDFLKPLLALPTLSKTCFSIPGVKTKNQVVEGWEGKSMLVYSCSIIREVCSGPQDGRGHFVCQLLFYSWRGVCRAGPQPGGLKPWPLLGYGLLAARDLLKFTFHARIGSRGCALCSVGFKTGAGKEKGGGSEVGGAT